MKHNVVDMTKMKETTDFSRWYITIFDHIGYYFFLIFKFYKL